VDEQRDNLLDMTISQSSRPARTKRKRFILPLNKREKKRELVCDKLPVSSETLVRIGLNWSFPTLQFTSKGLLGKLASYRLN
jgi:hypothetical protein